MSNESDVKWIAIRLQLSQIKTRRVINITGRTDNALQFPIPKFKIIHEIRLSLMVYPNRAMTLFS
jgi:hypothetical protein